MKAAIENIEERNASWKRRHETAKRLPERYDKEKLLRRFLDEGKVIRYLYEEEELSLRQVAKVLGCCKRTVQNKMRKHGIKARTKSEAQRIVWDHL